MKFKPLIGLKREKLPDDQISKLHEWLRQPSGSILRRMLKHRVQEFQLAAAEEAQKARKFDRFHEDGQVALDKAFRYQTALDVLNEFSSPDTEQYTIRITEE